MKFYKLLLAICLFGFLISSFSCKKEKSDENGTEKYVTLDKQSVKLNVGQQLILTPSFGEITAPKRSYEWISENPQIVEVKAGENNKGILTGKSEGTTTVKFSSTDGVVYAACQIVVTNVIGDGVTKILAIGNSFSEDAIESYLYQMAKASGEEVVIGNLYIGGATLDMHWDNATNNRSVYEYRKIGQDGNKVNRVSTSIATALADDNWDYISFQQASQNSGQYNTYVTPLPLLYNYVKTKASNPDVKYIFHQTWAYAKNSTHDGFVNYGKNQLTMYNAIVDAVGRAKALLNLPVVVPVGTAIQNGRTSLIGDNFTRDGYHLDIIGRYTAAGTWFETIFGKSAIGNLYKPNEISDYDAKIAQTAAHLAVLKPNEITEMVDFQGVGYLGAPVYIGFGFDNPVVGWNGFMGANSQRVGAAVTNLKDFNGKATGIDISITQDFNIRNTAGERTTTIDWPIPGDISVNSYFGNPKAAFEGKTITQSSLKVTGLNKDKEYNFCFFGSRSGVGDNRETSFTVKGANEKTALLNTSNNRTQTACNNNIKPNNSGEVTIVVTAGPNNNNGNGFYYLSAMRITAAE